MEQAARSHSNKQLVPQKLTTNLEPPQYFTAGVERVWVIYPSQSQVYVYSSPTSNTILAANEELDGEHLLPGFRLRLGELFEG